MCSAAYLSIPGDSVVKNSPANKQEMEVWFLGQEDPLEDYMIVHSTILTWEIPWTKVPGRLHSMRGVVKESDMT